jgi:CheY-like chemotaxis protein/anti-sigma regulatory factor (Ser/Thr protein kinase)
MSHELRTPLNAILGFSRLLKRRNTQPELREDVEVICSNGEHLLQLINQVLDLSKIESGHMAIHESIFDFHDLLANLEETFALQAKSKGVDVVVSRGEGVPVYISADPLRLREVLLNLLGNALKFTERGRVVLSIEAGQIVDSRCRMSFVVQDTGPGIGHEDLQRVFEAFMQTQSGQKRGEGTGLGLTISRNYVQLMGGELKLESELGRGTTAYFDIPVGIPEEPFAAPHIRKERVIGLAPGQQKFRILVADDRQVARHLLRRILEPLGFEVREASDGTEVLALWKEWQPHLICMDIRMPVMDGVEATRHIRAEAGGGETVIVAVTASSFEEDRAQILASGFDDYMRKPFDEPELFDVLRRRLGVQLVYEESEGGAARLYGETLAGLEQTLEAMPDVLRRALYSALCDLDTDEVVKIMDQVNKYDPKISRVLRSFTDNYQYGKLLRILESTSPMKGKL